MAGKPAKMIAPPKRTTAAVFSDPPIGSADYFTPNWDAKASAGQAMERSAKRARMGVKKTPIGCGTLTKRG